MHEFINIKLYWGTLLNMGFIVWMQVNKWETSQYSLSLPSRKEIARYVHKTLCFFEESNSINRKIITGMS